MNVGALEEAVLSSSELENRTGGWQSLGGKLKNQEDQKIIFASRFPFRCTLKRRVIL